MKPEQCRQRADGAWICDECGFAYDLPVETVTQRLSDASARVRDVVANINAARLDTAPRPGIWTPREYLAHLTDWYEIIAERIDLILHQQRPTLPGLDQDLLATERAYATWDVSPTLDRFEAAAQRSRRLLDASSPDDWDRLGLRDDIGELPLSLFANDLIHELKHHLLDIAGTPPHRP